MATIMLSRGRPEVVLSLTSTGLAPNDYRIPQDIQGARFAWAVVVTGATANEVDMEASVDGINWGNSGTGFTPFDKSVSVGTEARVVVVEGIMGVRFRWLSTTGGTQCTVTVRCA